MVIHRYIYINNKFLIILLSGYIYDLFKCLNKHSINQSIINKWTKHTHIYIIYLQTCTKHKIGCTMYIVQHCTLYTVQLDN